MLGPTAVGKTAMSIRLAKAFNTEIVSADSRQIYREIPIGTAAPTGEELLQVKHHFIGSKSITEDYSAGDFEADALFLLDKLFKRNDVVIMTGGSGLYVKAVTHGLDEHPSDLDVRNTLISGFQKHGLKWLQQELLERDPATYRVIDLSNHQRIIRALEVCITSGMPYSGFLTHSAKNRPFNVIEIGLELPREVLNERINRRVDLMMQAGLENEARSFFHQRHLNALQTVGYKELFDSFEGKCTISQAVEDIKTHTRRFAKRQMTWFRKNSNSKWFSPDEFDKIVAFVRARTDLN